MGPKYIQHNIYQHTSSTSGVSIPPEVVYSDTAAVVSNHSNIIPALR